ncbi:MAG: hypothetical protein QXI60_07605 [Thermofilaceae archaeon]
MNLFKRFLKWWRWLWRVRIADIRQPRTLFFLIADHLETRTLPVEPCGLRVSVPAADWAWLQQRQLQEVYECGLTAFTKQLLQRVGVAPVIRQVELVEGEEWKLEWYALPPFEARSGDVDTRSLTTIDEATITPAATTSYSPVSNDASPVHSEQIYGYFIVPDIEGGAWIPWRSPHNPRVPTDAEARASAEHLNDILRGLIPSTNSQPWRSGESYTVCSKQVMFLKIEVDQA